MFVTSCRGAVEQSMLADWRFQINGIRSVIPHQLLDSWGRPPTPQVYFIQVAFLLSSTAPISPKNTEHSLVVLGQTQVKILNITFS